jgi:hypothetical protein
MKVPIVRLKIRVRLPDGSRPYLDPVFAANSKLKPSFALLNDKPTHCPDGVYHLRYLKGGTRVWEAVGSDAQFALGQQQKRQMMLGARAVGVAVVEDKPSSPNRPKLARNERAVGVTVVQDRPSSQNLTELEAAVADYLAEVAAHKGKRTHLAYSLPLKLFLESCSKPSVEDISRKDILAFMSYIKAKGNGPRTVANRVGYLTGFLRSQDVSSPLLKSDRPRYTEKVVSAYSAREISSLVAAADQEAAEIIQFFLFTGAREQEVQYATWRDVDFDAKTFGVHEKRDLGFTPKDKEEGAIPIPDSLVELLRDRLRRNPGTRLIFANSEGNPQGHFLRILKRVGTGISEHCFAGADETIVLRQFWPVIQPCDLFIGRTTLEFDLDTVRQRSLFLGIKPLDSFELQRFYSHEPTDLVHLMAAWQGSRVPATPGLSTLLSPHWSSIQAAKVNEWWRTQEFESITINAARNSRLVYRGYLSLTSQAIPDHFKAICGKVKSGP